MAREITRWRHQHDVMVDMLIAEPMITNEEMAAQFGVTSTWISMLRNSQIFQKKLLARREEVMNPLLLASIEEKIAAVAHRSVEVMLEKLQKPAEQISDAMVLRSAEFGAKALGIGQKGPDAPAEMHEDHLQELAKRLVSLQQTHRRTSGAEDVVYVEGEVRKADPDA